MKKLIALLLVAVMVFSFAACGKKEETVTKTEDGKNVFSWWIPLYSSVEQNAASFSDVPLYQEIEKRTNTAAL